MAAKFDSGANWPCTQPVGMGGGGLAAPEPPPPQALRIAAAKGSTIACSLAQKHHMEHPYFVHSCRMRIVQNVPATRNQV